MSEQLKRSTITALEKAYARYMDRNWEVYAKSIHEARTQIEEIRSLGDDLDRMGRKLEVLYLTGEELLITAFAYLGKPWEMRMYYELAAYYMTVFNSNILTRDSEYLPPDIDLLEAFPLPETDPEEAMEEFAKAMEAYGNITQGGGRGVDKLYRAALLCQMGDVGEARYCTKLAKNEGGVWIRAHADRLEAMINSKAPEVRRTK